MESAYKKPYTQSHYTPSQWEELPSEVKFNIFKELFENAKSKRDVRNIYSRYAGLSWKDNQIFQSVAAQYIRGVPTVPTGFAGTTANISFERNGPPLDSCNSFGAGGGMGCLGTGEFWQLRTSGMDADTAVKLVNNGTVDQVLNDNPRISPDEIVWNCPCMTVDFYLDSLGNFITRMIYNDPKGYFTFKDFVTVVLNYYNNPLLPEEISFIINYANEKININKNLSPLNERYQVLTPEQWIAESFMTGPEKVYKMLTGKINRSYPRSGRYLVMGARYVQMDNQWIVSMS